MTDSPHHWMEKALAAAYRALPKDVPVGALVLDGEGKLLATAWNQREVDADPTGHAEILAMRQAAKTLNSWRLSYCTLYVTLEPCPMCASAIIQARIAQVVFGAWDPLMGACGSRYNLFVDHPQVRVIGGVKEAECQSQLRDFFNGLRQNDIR